MRSMNKCTSVGQISLVFLTFYIVFFCESATMSTTQELLDAARPAWKQATSGPFLTAARDGTLPKEAFDKWLFQDYHFGREFTRLVGHILSIAPAEAMMLLLGGLTAVDDELKWFQAHYALATLGERGVGVTEITPECREYCRFLQAVQSEPLAVQLVVLWAVEASYYEAWRSHRPLADPYDAYAERWASPKFADYVTQLALQADRALSWQPPEIQRLAGDAFREVCRLEKSFWDMVATS